MYSLTRAHASPSTPTLQARESQFCFVWLLCSVVMMAVVIVDEGHTALAHPALSDRDSLPTHLEVREG